MTDDERWPRRIASIGVIGAGRVGCSLCKRLAHEGQRAGVNQIAAFDNDPAKLAELENADVAICTSLAHLVDKVDLILLCLPDAGDVAKIARSHEGLLDCVHRGQIIIDHGWSSLDLTRQLATAFTSKGTALLDAPIAKSGKVDRAIDAGHLAISIGGDAAAINAVLPSLGCYASDITHVGAIGTAQVVRQLGDLIAFQTFAALAEAFVTARAFGIDGKNLFDALAKRHGGDSGTGHQQLTAFLAVDDALKEDQTSIAEAGRRLDDAISLARGKKLTLAGADSTLALFQLAKEKGLGDEGLNGLFNVMEPESRAGERARNTSDDAHRPERQQAKSLSPGGARQARG